MNSKRLRRHLFRVGISVGLLLVVVIGLTIGIELLTEAPETDESTPLPFPGVRAFTLSLRTVITVIPVLLALVAVVIIPTRFLRDLHDIPTLAEAHDLLNRLSFGLLFGRPYIIVKEGAVNRGKGSVAHRVGGPARLVLFNDTAVVTERNGCTYRILGPGLHTLERFEKVWEVVDLRPQHWTYEVFALTKEGIPVSCEADLAFQIDDGDGEESVNADGPYPFSEEAVFRAATSRWVRAPGHEEATRDWTGRIVIGFAEGLLRNILAGYRLDWLITPSESDSPENPRETIREQLEHELKQRVGSVGARLLDVQLGSINVKAREEEVSEKLSKAIGDQWIEAWNAEWRAHALAGQAEGEAELLRMDTARIQAQAEMVMTLTESLQGTIVNRGAVEPYILALRFVETLRWMSYNTVTRELMPPEALRTLNRLRRMLEERKGEGKGGAEVEVERQELPRLEEE